MSHTETPLAVHEWFASIGDKSACTRRARIAAQVARDFPDVTDEIRARLTDHLWRQHMRDLASRGGKASQRLWHERKEASQTPQNGPQRADTAE